MIKLQNTKDKIKNTKDKNLRKLMKIKTQKKKLKFILIRITHKR